MSTYVSHLFGILGLLICNCCAIYQQEFDCLPPCGVPCTSETELESMVVETKHGPDLFIPNDQLMPHLGN